MKKLSVIALMSISSLSMAQLFSGSGTGGAIPDGAGSATPGTALTSTVTVPGSFSNPIAEVWIDFSGLAHTWAGDLTIRLIAPNSTALDILSRPGRGSASTFGFNTDFDGVSAYGFRDSGADLFATTPPAIIPGGVYRSSTNPNPPGTNASAWSYMATSFNVFNGMSAVGTWTIELTDWAGGDVGSMNGWTLNVQAVPEPSTMIALGAGALALLRRRRKAA